MKNINRVEFEGCVGKDAPKCIFGTTYSFSVAIGCDYKGKNDAEWTKKTCWVNITCIGDPNLDKGNKVNIKGFLDPSEGKDGKTYINYKCFAKDVMKLDEFTRRDAAPIPAKVYKQNEDYKQDVNPDDEAPF